MSANKKATNYDIEFDVVSWRSTLEIQVAGDSPVE